MTNFEKICAALDELKVSLLNAVMAADCSKAMERWLEMEAEQEHEAAAEAYPKAEITEINGETCLYVQTYSSTPEGGGGFVYPMVKGGNGAIILYRNGEAFAEAERKKTGGC